MQKLRLKQAQKREQKQEQPKIGFIQRILLAFGVTLKHKSGQKWKVEAVARNPYAGSEGALYCTRGSGCGKEYREFPPSDFGVKIEDGKLFQ